MYVCMRHGTVMSLAVVSSVCAVVYLIVCALGDGVDGQNPPQKPQDVSEAGSAGAEDEPSSSIVSISASRAGAGRLRLRCWLQMRQFYGDEQRPCLTKVILHMSGGLRTSMFIHTYIHTYIPSDTCRSSRTTLSQRHCRKIPARSCCSHRRHTGCMRRA